MSRYLNGGRQLWCSPPIIVNRHVPAVCAMSPKTMMTNVLSCVVFTIMPAVIVRPSSSQDTSMNLQPGQNYDVIHIAKSPVQFHPIHHRIPSSKEACSQVSDLGSKEHFQRNIGLEYPMKLSKAVVKRSR